MSSIVMLLVTIGLTEQAKYLTSRDLEAFDDDELRYLQEETEERFKNTTELVFFILIPIVSGIVGYFTNWLALKMTFYPTRTVGWELFRPEGAPVFLFGFEGIIPSKVADMAAKSVRLMTEKLFDIQEIMGRLDGEKASSEMKPAFEKTLSKIVDEVLKEQFPNDYLNIASAIKESLLQWAGDELPSFSKAFMEDLVQNLDDVFDLEFMVVTEFSQNKGLLNEIFMKVGAKEILKSEQG
jgi:uncharacterized membrane protein YheB (UPF0754 family)